MKNNIITNGFQKMGNHALVKACELLGVPAKVNHISYKQGLPEGITHHLFTKRDPRNTIISKLRMDGHSVTPGTFIAKFRDWGNGTSFVEALGEFEGWLNEAFVVKFEDLIKDDTEIKRIAVYLDTPYIDGAFEELPGMTITWTGEYSDYTKIWTPQVDEVWNNEGGKELLIKWNY